MSDPTRWQPGTRIINRDGRIKVLSERPERGKSGWVTPSWWVGERFDHGGSSFYGDEELAADWLPLDAATVAALFDNAAERDRLRRAFIEKFGATEDEAAEAAALPRMENLYYYHRLRHSPLLIVEGEKRGPLNHADAMQQIAEEA